MVDLMKDYVGPFKQSNKAQSFSLPMFFLLMIYDSQGRNIFLILIVLDFTMILQHNRF